MAEYIEKQAAIDALKAYFSDEENPEIELGAYWYHTSVIKCLEEIPPADVRPVRRGRWIDYDDDYGVYSCSECEKNAPEDTQWDFCPNCGADMRGGDAG